jgi:acyl-CoA synthetase (AMP-forming)/AMP-acid ligase II
MTDATAAVTQTRVGRAARRHSIAAANLSVGEAAVGRTPGPAVRREVLSCGPVLPSHAVRIVDDAGNALPEGRLGHIAISGRCIAAPLGQGPAPPADAELRTGDLGFMLDGELYPVGRSSDLVIVRGVNVWPQAVEGEVVRAIAIAGAACVAFGVPDAARGTESLVVVAEHPGPSAAPPHLQKRITEAVGLVTSVPPSAVLLRPVGAIARTPSGKIDRHATRERFLANEL